MTYKTLSKLQISDLASLLTAVQGVGQHVVENTGRVSCIDFSPCFFSVANTSIILADFFIY